MALLDFSLIIGLRDRLFTTELLESFDPLRFHFQVLSAL
jgi:hypothetical protein